MPRFPACRAASTWDTCGDGWHELGTGAATRARPSASGQVGLGVQQGPRAPPRVPPSPPCSPLVPLPPWQVQQGPICPARHLLRDFAGALDQLLLGVGIAGAALQGSSLGHQCGASMAQLLHPVLDVEADLGRMQGCHPEWAQHQDPSVSHGEPQLSPPAPARHPSAPTTKGPAPAPPLDPHLLVLSSEGSGLGLVCQLPVLAGELVGQSAQLVGAGCGLGDL